MDVERERQWEQEGEWIWHNVLKWPEGCICLAVDSTFKCRATKLIVGKPSPKYMKRGKSKEGWALSWLKCLAEKRGGMNLSIESETDKRESPTGRACAFQCEPSFEMANNPPLPVIFLLKQTGWTTKCVLSLAQILITMITFNHLLSIWKMWQT